MRHAEPVVPAILIHGRRQAISLIDWVKMVEANHHAFPS